MWYILTVSLKQKILTYASGKTQQKKEKYSLKRRWHLNMHVYLSLYQAKDGKEGQNSIVKRYQKRARETWIHVDMIIVCMKYHGSLIHISNFYFEKVYK